LTEVLEAVRETDVLVLASPVYYWDVSSQMKAFLDRTFSYLVPDFITNPKKSRLSPGKKFVLILAQNNADRNSFPEIFRKFDYFFKAYGFAERHLIRAFGVNEPGEVEAHEDVMKVAETTAEKICNGL
jgi:multimeric flavodoxin WrbA